MALSKEKKEEIIRQLNEGFTLRGIAKNMKCSADTVLRIKRRLDEEKRDIETTVEVLTNTGQYIDEIKNKYDPEKFKEIMNKSVDLTMKYDEIDKIAANGLKPLVEANFIGANIFSNEVMLNIKNGTVSAEQIAQMVAINNEAIKISNTAKDSLREGVLKEQAKDSQLTIDYDSLDDVEATRAYMREMSN